MNIFRVALALAATVITLAVPASAAPAPRPRVLASQLIPIPAGPLAAVTNEKGYNAFPAVARPASGRILAVYGSAATHDGPLSDWTQRRSLDGRVWSAPEIVPPSPSATYSYGPAGGIAAETAEQGGRIYLTVQRAHWPETASTSPDEQRYWLYTSDDDAATWQQRGQFPVTPGKWGFGASNMLLLADGSLLFCGYSSDGVIRFMTSSDRGATLTPNAATLTVAGRIQSSPKCGQLSDGRVFVIFRSDAAPWQSRYYYSMRAPDGTWGAPALLWPDATTLGGMTVLNDDTIAVLYRGWSDRTDDGPQYRPLRVMLAGADGAGLRVWRANVDLNPALRARFLGGQIVALDGSACVAVWGIEGPLTTATAAAIVSMPVEFKPSP